MNSFISVLSSITIGLTSVTQLASSRIQLVSQKSNVVCLQTWNVKLKRTLI